MLAAGFIRSVVSNFLVLVPTDSTVTSNNRDHSGFLFNTTGPDVHNLKENLDTFQRP